MSDSWRWRKVAKKANLTYVGARQEPIPSEITKAVLIRGGLSINTTRVKATLLLHGNKNNREWAIFNCLSYQSIKQAIILYNTHRTFITVISVSVKKSLPHCYINKKDILDAVLDKLIQKNPEKIIAETIGNYSITGDNTRECKLMISKITTFLQEKDLPYIIETNGNKVIVIIKRRKMSFYREFPNELAKIEQFINILDSN